MALTPQQLAHAEQRLLNPAPWRVGSYLAWKRPDHS
jgi:hypothetical protein